MESVATYSPRPWQTFAHLHRRRFSVFVWHRRAGKTVYAVNELIRTALERPGSTCAYLAPLYTQSKRVAWPYLKQYSQHYGATYNEAELRADFPNHSRLYLLGGASGDYLRGIGLDLVVIDEVAQMPESTWTQVIRPALADRQGGAIFIGTPQGMLNPFYRLFEQANQPGWCRQLLKVTDTDALKPDEVETLRREMSKADFAQELECDWSAAVRGAFFGEEMNDAEKSARITTVPYDKALPVHTSWDLGFSDLTVIWYWQVQGAQIRAIRCDAFEQTALPDILAHVRSLPYQRWGKHFGPHDLKVKEFSSGRSRLELAQSLGFRFEVVANIPVRDGIEALRVLIPRMVFDRGNCKEGVEALKLYRTEHDPVKQVYKLSPLHDWTSHYADAARYFALGYRDGMDAATKPLDYSKLDRMVI